MGEKMTTGIAYGKALAEFGPKSEVYVLDADVSSCTMSIEFAKICPERFFNMGIAEANMAGAAAGIATCGGAAVIHTFAIFAAGRIYDQVRNSIAYPGLNVKIAGTHAGFTNGKDGATHQSIEDISLMREIPGMTVLVPCDSNETRLAVKAMLEMKGPCYIRLGHTEVDTVTDQIPGYHYEIGKGAQLKEGTDVTIIACGLMVQMALAAAEMLDKEGIHARVIDMHTIKPIDRECILKAAKETGAIVTAEMHSVLGGLGSAAAEVLTEECLVPLERVGVEDRFGHSATTEELFEKYGLTAENIVKHAKCAIERKKN